MINLIRSHLDTKTRTSKEKRRKLLQRAIDLLEPRLFDTPADYQETTNLLRRLYNLNEEN